MSLEEWIHYAGSVLGAGGSGLAGYVLSHFKTVQKTADLGLKLARALKEDVDDLRHRIDEITQENQYKEKESISRADLTVESMQGQLEALRRELQTTREQLNTSQQEFKNYTQRELEKWTDLIRDVAEIRGLLREPSLWNRHR